MSIYETITIIILMIFSTVYYLRYSTLKKRYMKAIIENLDMKEKLYGFEGKRPMVRRK